MITLVAFCESIDEAGVFANIAAAADQHVSVQGDNIRVPEEFANIFGVAAYIGTTGTRVRLNSPSLRQFQNLYVAPVNQVIVPTGNDVYDMHPEALVQLTPSENLQCEVNANPAAAELHTVGVFLSKGEINPVRGRIRSVPFTLTIVVTSGVWTLGSITLDEELPEGKYTIVGARLECAVATLARFVLNSQYNRPGFPCSADEDFRFRDNFRYGRLGEWGNFSHINLPQMEVLGSTTTASADYTGMMDVLTK